MKLPVIKLLVETYTLEQLTAAEEAILNEETPAIEIEGSDEGEQLTHAIAAIEILKDVADNGADVRTAMRNYTQRVRNSIS
jgi:hypothetical protein